MPMRFSVAQTGRADSIEDNLIGLSYRLFDLMPLAERVAAVMEQSNQDGAMMGIDIHGSQYLEVAEYTRKHRGGTGPPLAPQGIASRIVSGFDTSIEGGQFDEIIVRGHWPGIHWVKFHVTGAPAIGMPPRNPVGLRPHAWQMLQREFELWIQEVLSGQHRGGTPPPRRPGGAGGGAGGRPRGGGPRGPAAPAGYHWATYSRERPLFGQVSGRFLRRNRGAGATTPPVGGGGPSRTTSAGVQPSGSAEVQPSGSAGVQARAPTIPVPTSRAAPAPILAGPSSVSEVNIGTRSSPAATMPIEEFASRTVAAAEASPTGKFGDSKTFISHVWQVVRRDPAFQGMDEKMFKTRLIEANRARVLELGRGDLIEAMDPADVRGSSTPYLNADYHFIRFDPQSRPRRGN